eukprot:scaffold2251_cov136-Skeletonema_menzelii.AAC.1
MDAEQKEGAAADASGHSDITKVVASTVWNGYDCVFSNDDYLKKLQKEERDRRKELSSEYLGTSFRRRGSH